jgi:hypothetical protein
LELFNIDDLARQFGKGLPRRGLLAGIAASVVGLAPAVEARKKHKHKHKPRQAKPNAFGCLSVGNACRSAEQCCSGICERKKCRLHGAGTCDQKAQDFCAVSEPDVAQTLCDGSQSCVCVRTTAGSHFCGGPTSACADCQTDSNCEALGFPTGSACAPFTEGRCAGACEHDTACLVPCDPSPPES